MGDVRYTNTIAQDHFTERFLVTGQANHMQLGQTQVRILFMKSKKDIVLIVRWIIAVLIITVCALPFILAAVYYSLMVINSRHFDEATEPWMVCTIDHADLETQITLLRKSVHSHLAEYQYKIRFGVPPESVEKPLFFSGGGVSLIDFYWYPGNEACSPFLRTKSKDGEYIIDLAEKRILVLFRKYGGVFIEEVTSYDRRLGCSEFWENDETHLRVTINEKEVKNNSDSPYAFETGTFIGKIDGGGYTLKYIPGGEKYDQSGYESAEKIGARFNSGMDK
jgi:hypothetical protein